MRTRVPESCGPDRAAEARRIIDSGCNGLDDGKSDGNLACSFLAELVGSCDPHRGHDNEHYVDALMAFAPPGSYEGVGHETSRVEEAGDHVPCNVNIQHQDEHGIKEASVHISWEGPQGSVRFVLATYEHITLKHWEESRGLMEARVRNAFAALRDQSLRWVNAHIMPADELGEWHYSLTVDNDGLEFTCQYSPDRPTDHD